MGNSWLTGFLFLFNYFIAIGAIVVPDPGLTQHQTSHRVHQKRTQAPQKCDLICPGQPPLALPPNFIQNCTSTGSKTTTTPRPSRTTTTESSEESTESDTTENGTTARTGKHQGILKKHNRTQKHAQTETHQSKQTQQKHKWKKKTVIFKKDAKSRLFKEKIRLDGCYVVCSDENGDVNGGSDGQQDNDPATNESDSSETDPEDNYVEGEDTPVEIIYIPSLDQGNKRPAEVYQINNYELVNPLPAVNFGYDPVFMEGKQKIKRRKQEVKKKKIDNKKSSKGSNNKSM